MVPLVRLGSKVFRSEMNTKNGGEGEEDSRFHGLVSLLAENRSEAVGAKRKSENLSS